MVDPEGFRHTPAQLKDASEKFDKALGLLQLTDLTSAAVTETAPQHIQTLLMDTLEALEQLQMASLRIEEEAKALRSSFDLMKGTLNERKRRKVGLVGSAVCVRKSLVLSHLYPNVGVPIAYLTLASPLPRIIMKRRAFT